jgi:hypothetical protein
MGCIILERFRRRSTSPLRKSKEGARDAVASAHTRWLVVQNYGDHADGARTGINLITCAKMVVVKVII